MHHRLAAIVMPDGELPPDVMDAIDSYSPRRAIWNWAVLGEFVRDAVYRARPYNARKAKEFMSIGTYHVNYWTDTQGYDLSDELWDLDLAQAYVATLPLTGRTVTQSRMHLRDLIKRLLLERDHPTWGEMDSRSAPMTPYRDTEIAALFSWADGRSTIRAKRISRALLSLGLGYGLTAAEMVAARVADIDDRGDAGVWLTLPDRVIPCDDAFEPDVRRMLADHRHEIRFLPHDKPEDVDNFLGSARHVKPPKAGNRPHLRRLRATWLAHRTSHLSALLAIMRGYGISHANTLQAALQFIPEPDPDYTTAVLRTTNPEGVHHAHT
jgi:integrase